jgi:hypothetical protein
MRRALIGLGWIVTIPGFVGLLGLAVIFTDAEWVFGCQPSGILRITCPQDPLGWLGELLFIAGLVTVVWFPATLLPTIYALAFPIARLVIRRRRIAAPGAL